MLKKAEKASGTLPGPFYVDSLWINSLYFSVKCRKKKHRIRILMNR
ncbi:hypothetical protein L21SP2_0009 [Salinispira pacifica]|uniref:Uncharacterized protein n=1 Tax=Salinispira pacifica TaxID=1307761 RepID=V5WCX3_9SPIO|nr:hypothetical protein L21SP2_0009 [Salinispira pacifica]